MSAEACAAIREDPYPVRDLRAFLMGAWTLRRTLEDRRRGARGRFEGEALFGPSGRSLLAYREEGRLVLGGFETVACQDYLYAFPVRALAEVRFADGRPFHALDLRTGRWAAEHLCAADRYRGTFRALGPDRWTARWEIAGPRKDQVLTSLFTRAA